MKAILFGGSAIILGAGVYMHGGLGEPNVYAMPAAQAYERLAGVHIEPSGDGPFFMLQTTVSRPSPRMVVWSASGDMAAHRCALTITPLETDSSRVDVSCNGGGAGSGAAAGLEINMIRKRVIEQVDATLDGRPFDPRRAAGATAARWPADVVDHGDFQDATAKALEMDREARRISDR